MGLPELWQVPSTCAIHTVLPKRMSDLLPMLHKVPLLSFLKITSLLFYLKKEVSLNCVLFFGYIACTYQRVKERMNENSGEKKD